jgi:hypothetical protein
MGRVIEEIVTCLGVQEHRQVLPVQHQPLDYSAQLGARELDLKLCLRQRSAGPVPPARYLGASSVRNHRAHGAGLIGTSRVEEHMSMKGEHLTSLPHPLAQGYATAIDRL